MDIPEFEDDDQTIENLVNAGIDYVETQCNLQLGISDYEWYTSCLPYEIPDTFYVRSITSIESVASGGPTIINPSNYEFIRMSKRRCCIQWNNDYSNNATSFLVKFKAGFEEGYVPEALLMAVRAFIGDGYVNREDPIREKRTLVDKLISPFVLPYV
ncbi:hypothetical protein LZG74_16885 [Dyadobacter sp. CY327]|uniref:hypothetical protein n=1 Tax=Dyadobacter sp. CY327 TaxID=2907301 RepID=UPI001F489D29|nr:hypothetical protein [Dyadobacter sp. CY327]MCE7071994.1 hypothetical protein [Dyadobacter sp. CY327]